MSLAAYRKQYPILNQLSDQQILDTVAGAYGYKPDSPDYASLKSDLLGYDRTWGEAAKDTAVQLGQGLAGVGKDVAMLGASVIPGVSTYNNPVVQKLGDWQQGLDQYKSPGLQNQMADAQVTSDIAQRQAAASGASPVGQIASEAGTQLGNYWRHPALLGQDIVTNLPQVAVGVASGGLAKGASLGLKLGEVGATRLGIGTAVGTGAAMQGIDTAGQAYQEMIKQGATPEQATRLANQVALKSGVVSAGLNMLPGAHSVEQRFLGGNVGGFGLGRLGTVARTGLTEAGTEAADEGYSQFAQNQASQVIDPTTSLTKGVGQAAVQGAVATGPLGIYSGMTGHMDHAAPRTETGEIDLSQTPGTMHHSDANGMSVNWQDAVAAAPTLPGDTSVPAAVRRGLDPLNERSSAYPPPAAPSFVDLMGNKSPVQMTPANFADLYGQQTDTPSPYDVPPGTTPPGPPPAPPGPPPGSIGPTHGQGDGVMQVASDGTVIPPQSPEQQAAIDAARQAQAEQAQQAQIGPQLPPPDASQPNRGQLIAAYHQAGGKAPVVTKAGELSGARNVSALRPILESPEPLDTMRSLYQDGNQQGNRDELLDNWHKALTGQTISEWKQSQAQVQADGLAQTQTTEPQQAPPTLPTNSAGFVPEPQAQTEAQLAAVKDGRKPAAVFGVGEAKKMDLTGLSQKLVTDPKTRKRAVVVANDQATIDRTAARVKEVGLKQAMGEVLNYANPDLTTHPTPDAAMLQQRDNTSGQVLDEQLVRPADVPNVTPVPGTTPRVIPVEQALAERQMASAAPVNAVNSPVPGVPASRSSFSKLVSTVENSKNEAEYNDALYGLYRMWKLGGKNEAKAYDYLAKNDPTPAEHKMLEERWATERGQQRGAAFDASVNEPTSDYGAPNAPAHSNMEEPANEQGDPYDHTETRPGTTEQQKDIGRKALDDTHKRIASLQHNRGGATVLGSRLYENFQAGKPNQLVGQRVQNTADLAILAQVYRDPRYETLRAVFVDGSGKIVGESGYSSRLAGAVDIPDGVYNDLVNDQLRFGAQGYYVMHNHPGGRATPSPADLVATTRMAQAAPGMLAHVVIDHNEFATITPQGLARVIPAPEFDGIDFTSRPELRHGMLGYKIDGPEGAAQLAKMLQIPDGHATVVMESGGKQGTVQLLVDMPMGLLDDASKLGITKATAWMRRMSRETGSGGHRFIVLPDGAPLTEAHHAYIESGVVTDVVTADGRSLGMTSAHWPGDVLRGDAMRTRRVYDNVPTYEAAEKSPLIKPFSDTAKLVAARVATEARGGEISDLKLSLMTLRQIDEQYGKKLPALKDWIGATLERGSASAKSAADANRVALKWEQAAVNKAVRKSLADVLLRASVAEVSLDNHSPAYLKTLTPSQLAEHTELNRTLASLPQAARDVRAEALDVMRKQWQNTREALETFINHTISDPGVRAERIKALDTEMGRNRGDYFPLARFGDRIVTGRGAAKDGRDVVSFHETAASVDAEVARLKAQGVKKIDVTLRTERDPRQRATTGFMGDLHTEIDKSGADTAVKESLHEALQQLYLRSLPELSGAKHMMRRENIEGYSQNALRSFADSVTRGSHYAARLEYGPRIQAAMEAAESQSRSSERRTAAVVIGQKEGASPAVRVVPVGTERLNAFNNLADDGYEVSYHNTTPETAKETLASQLKDAAPEQLADYVNQVEQVVGRSAGGVEDMRASKALYNHLVKMQNDDASRTHSKVVDALGAAGYTWYLGFTPAFWLMNVLQNPMIGIPQLGAKYGVGKAGAEWLGAAKWFAGTRFGKLINDAKTPFSVSWMRDAVRDGKLKGISKGELDMLQSLEDRQVLDFTQAMDLTRIGQAASDTRYKFLRFAAAGAHHTEVFNRVTFALAAYRLALKSSGDVTHEQAVRRAEDDVSSAHFDYSPANKPAMMRGPARLVFMFQQYRQHMLYWWAKQVKDMVQNENPGDRAQALKGAALMGLSHLALAGAVGLPFMGSAAFLLNMLMPDDKDGVKFDLNRWLAQGAEDATGSKKAGDVFAHGLFSLLNMNISQRIGQADLMPVLNENGSAKFAHNKRDAMQDRLVDMLGPLGSIAVNMGAGMDSMAKGDTLGGLAQMTPKAVSDMLKAYQLETEGMKNKRGQFIATTEAFDGMDGALTAAGVTPSTVARIKADKGAVLDVEAGFKERRSAIQNQFIQAWTRQDSTGTAEALQEIQAYNRKTATGKFADKSLLITGRSLESAIKDFAHRSAILALSGGTAETRRQLLMATRMEGLFNPVTTALIRQRATTLQQDGLPGLPGLGDF